MASYEEKNLSEREFQIFQSEIKSHKRSVGLAYLLLLFTGGFGGHKFYLGRWGWGIFYTILFLFIIPTEGVTILIIGIFLIYDLITLPRQIEKVELEKKQEILNKIHNDYLNDEVDFLKE